MNEEDDKNVRPARPKMARTCWAATISQCSDEMSSEHVISKGIFADLPAEKRFVVFGPSGGQPSRKIGLNSLTVPILCRRHNSDLSNIDAIAKAWFSGIAQLVSKPIGKTGLEQGDSRALLEINGWEFEKWAAKTFLNMVLSDFGLSKDKPLPLSINTGHIQGVVFGENRLVAPQGLYGLPHGTNLFGDPKYNLSRLQASLITMPCRLGKQGVGWRGPLLLPVFLYLNCHGIELLMHANLTSLIDSDFETITASRRKHGQISRAGYRPGLFSFSIDHLDGIVEPKLAPRWAGFIWP